MKEQAPSNMLQSNSKQRLKQQSEGSNSIVLEQQIRATHQAVQQLTSQTSQIKLQNSKKLIYPNKESFILIAGNNRSRSNNQTFKRLSPYNANTDRNNEITKDEIRMKIILENSRLKKSIETLEQDICSNKNNELKILEIIRQSKAKISEYKDKVKDKSKKISELTDANMNLKSKISQLQSKLNQVSSFSEWQEGQIKELKQQVAIKAGKTQKRVLKLQYLLRNHEQQLAKYQYSRKISEIQNNLQPFSSQSIGDRSPYSIKQMDVKDLQQIKQCQFDIEDYNNTKQANVLLRNRLMDLEYELDQIRTENQLKQQNLILTQQEKTRKEIIFKEEIENIMEKSLQVTHKYQQQKISIVLLQKQLNQRNQTIKAKQQNFVKVEQELRKQIANLQDIINQNNHKILELKQQLEQKDQLFKRQLEQIQYQIDDKEASNNQIIKQLQQKCRQLRQNLQNNEEKMEEIIDKNEELINYKQQNQQKIRQASRLIIQRRQYSQMIQKLKDELEYYKKLPQDNLRYYEDRLADNNIQIKLLEREKQDLHQEMEHYAVELRLLKNQISQLNREKNDSLLSNSQNGRIIEELKQDSQDMQNSGTSIKNQQKYKIKIEKANSEEQMLPFFPSETLDPYEFAKQQNTKGEKSELHLLINKKNQTINELQKVINQLKNNFQLKLQQEINRHTIQIIQTNYKLEQEKQEQKLLKEKLSKAQKALTQANSSIMIKLSQIQSREHVIYRSQKTINDKDVLLFQVKGLVDKRDEDILRQKEFISKLEEHIESQRLKNKQLSGNISKLTEKLTQLEVYIEQLKQQSETLAAKKNELDTSLQMELVQKKQMEDELMNSRRLVEVVQSEHLTEKGVINSLKEQIQKYISKYRQLQDRVRVLSSQKNKMHEDIIERMTEKDALIQKIGHLSLEVDEQKGKEKTNLQVIKQIAKQQQQLAVKTIYIQDISQKLEKTLLRMNQLQVLSKRTQFQFQQREQILSGIINEQKTNIEKLTHQKVQLLSHQQLQVHSNKQLISDKKILEEQKQISQKKLSLQLDLNRQLKEQIEKLHFEFDFYLEENNRLKNKLFSCESQLMLTQSERDKAISEVAQLNKVNEQLKIKIENHQSIIKHLSINIANLKESLSFSHSQHENIQNSMNKQHEDSIDLKLQEIEQSRFVFDNLKQDISQIQSKHKNVVEGYEHRLRSTSVRFQEATQQKEGKIKQLLEIIVNLKIELSEVTQIKNVQQVTIQELKQGMAVYKISIQKLQQQLIQLKEVIYQKDLLIQRLQSNVNLKKEEIDQKDRIFNQIQQKISVLSLQIQQKGIKNDNLQKQIDEQQNQYRLSKQKYEANMLKLIEQIQILSKLSQQSQQQYKLKISELNKEILTKKLLFQQAEKVSSLKIEQSNRSINQFQSKFKAQIDTIKRKDEEIVEQKAICNSLIQQLQVLKISYSRLEDQEIILKAKRQEEIQQLKKQINNLKTTINSQQADLQKIQVNLNKQQSTSKQLITQKEALKEQKLKLQLKIQRLTDQKSKLQLKLQSVALLKTKFQTQCEQLQQQNKKLLKKKDEQQEQMQISTMSLIGQRKQLQQKNQLLSKEKQELIQEMKNIHKQYQTRIQNVCLEQREVLLEVQNKHSKQLQSLNDRISKIERQNKRLIQIKQREKQFKEQFESIKQKYKRDERILKEFQNQRGELTDKILQLTQQNNQSTQVIQSLRNNVVAKGNEIQQCREIIYKLQQQVEQLKLQKSPLNSQKSINVVDSEQKLAQAYQQIQKLVVNNKQLLIREQSLELQLEERQKIEKQLNQKLQKLKEKQVRERNSSSCDSFASRSKIFDQKSHNLFAQLQQTKNKLESAEAYINLLEDQGQKPHQDSNAENRSQQLQKQVEDLKIKIQYLQAVITELDNLNLKSSVRSRRSQISKNMQNEEKAVERQSSDVNFNEQGMNKKIYLLIDFIQNYTRDRSSGDKQEELKVKLNHNTLEELLSTIFYRLEKQTIIYKDKQHMIQQLQEENENLQQELKNMIENHSLMTKKCSILQGQQKNYQESEKYLQDLLTNKMKDQADIAECRSYIQELENKLGKYQNKGKEVHQKQKERLQILQEEHESSSDSMMSENAQSQMPSSIHQSKEAQSRIDLRKKGKGQFLTMAMVQPESKNETISNSAFLQKCLKCIADLQKEIENIERQLQQKTKLLSLCLKESISKEELINRLTFIQSKIKMNDRQIRNHFETSQFEAALLIRELLKGRQQGGQYGLKNQSRRKIQEYLSLLEQQLNRNGKYYEYQNNKPQPSREGSPIRLGISLHQIKEDAANEDKGSSIVNQPIKSFSNYESEDINEIKHNFNETLKELHEAQEELNLKQETIKNLSQKYTIVQRQVAAMLDQLFINLQEDQYVFDQIEKIKKFMFKYMQEDHKINSSTSKIESDKASILLQSKNRNMSPSKKFENPLEKIMKLSLEQIQMHAQQMSNQNLKQIYQKIQELMNERFEDCLDFLNGQKSLIADILKMDEDQVQVTMNRLASKLTKQQITQIITNSHNRMEAKKTLFMILREDDSKSLASNENDFSPNPHKIQQIRNSVYHRPSQLSLSLHNQLLEILAAPTRNQFYNLIQTFFIIVKDFEDRFHNQLSEKQQLSQNHSIRIKKALEGKRQILDFSMENIDYLQNKHQKNRTNSCGINPAEISQSNVSK